MRALRLLFIFMVLLVQLFTSIVVTLSSEQILRALHTPQTLTGLISGSLSVIFMVILMAGLFLPQFDRMSRFIQLIDSARDIVEHVRSNEPLDPKLLDSYRNLAKARTWGADGNSPTAPTTKRAAAVRRQPPNSQDEWPYGR
ncbi:MAG: hypothetical protein ACLQUY_25365 [Ktedonobacterales bacterium]